MYSEVQKLKLGNKSRKSKIEVLRVLLLSMAHRSKGLDQIFAYGYPSPVSKFTELTYCRSQKRSLLPR